jgi:hypothetical protein
MEGNNNQRIHQLNKRFEASRLLERSDLSDAGNAIVLQY